jgi:hypothetical protein
MGFDPSSKAVLERNKYSTEAASAEAFSDQLVT